MKKVITLEENEYEMFLRCRNYVEQRLILQENKAKKGEPIATYSMGGKVIFTDIDYLKNILKV